MTATATAATSKIIEARAEEDRMLKTGVLMTEEEVGAAD
jgi:hypothetical protein